LLNYNAYTNLQLVTPFNFYLTIRTVKLRSLFVQILLSTQLNHLQISNWKHWQKRGDFCIKRPRYSRLSLLAEIFKCCSRFSSFSQLFRFFSVLQSYFLVLCSCRILFTVVLPFCFSSFLFFFFSIPEWLFVFVF
jgi:hypothetical protein